MQSSGVKQFCNFEDVTFVFEVAWSAVFQIVLVAWYIRTWRRTHVWGFFWKSSSRILLACYKHQSVNTNVKSVWKIREFLKGTMKIISLADWYCRSTFTLFTFLVHVSGSWIFFNDVKVGFPDVVSFWQAFITSSRKF